MAGRADWSRQLQGLDAAAWPAHLTEHSGLPGPRGNLELAVAVATLAEPSMIETLLATGDEYHAMCAAAATGRRADDPGARASARVLATDERWRVREGVAIGLQLLGDARPDVLLPIVSEWVDSPDPLVQRAALAAICEPRLLRTPDAVGAALDACGRATGSLVALPAQARRTPGARTLRQALGYCWSVAVAANPDRGLAAFGTLDSTDPDVAWIVNQNRRKKRLSVLLAP